MTLVDEARAARRLPAPNLARAIRQDAGISVARLAQELGVHRATLARWEAGEHRPRGSKRAAWATLLESIRGAQ